MKISSTQNESDLWAETEGRLVSARPSVDGEGLMWWMQKLERPPWMEGRSKAWLREVAEHPAAGSTSYAPHSAFLHLLQVHVPRPAAWAKPTPGRIQSGEAVYLCHFGQDTGLRASISWGQIVSWAQSGNPAAAGQTALYPVRWNHLTKSSSFLAKAFC